MKVEVGDLVRYVNNVHLPHLVGLVVDRGPYGYLIKWNKGRGQQTELLAWIEPIK
jgi:plastocyanin